MVEGTDISPYHDLELVSRSFVLGSRGHILHEWCICGHAHAVAVWTRLYPFQVSTPGGGRKYSN